MPKFTIFNPNNGQIIKVINCPENEVALNTPNGCSYISGECPDDAFFIENAIPVAKPTRHSEYHVFNYSTKKWSDPRTLADIKTTKWASIKDSRNVAEYSGFTWDTSLFDSDTVSQSRIQGASQLATLALMNNQPFSINWTLADNTVRTLTAQDMLAVGMALGEHINAQHAKARLKREAINAATTVEEVNAITW